MHGQRMCYQQDLSIEGADIDNIEMARLKLRLSCQVSHITFQIVGVHMLCRVQQVSILGVCEDRFTRIRRSIRATQPHSPQQTAMLFVDVLY
jgi:hypothetical protein